MTVNTVGSTTTLYPITSSVAASTSTGTIGSNATSSTSAGISTTSVVAKSSSATANITSSTTLVYGSASSTAKTVVSCTTPSACVTPSSCTTPSACTTPYAYLLHMGTDAQKEVEQALVNLGFDDKVDSNFVGAFDNFRKFVGMNKYDPYGVEVVNKLREINDEINGYPNLKKRLSDLGFYNSKSDLNVDEKSVEANSAPGNILKAMENFCRVYNKEFAINDLKKTVDQIKDIHIKYKKVLNSKNLDSMLKDLGTTKNIQKTNFAKSWVFLKEGMGFSDKLASAIMANWRAEGGFSESNLQDTGEDNDLIDLDYDYKTYDAKGFGIMQWTLSSRKDNLLNIAKDMDSGVGNINVQFATFRDEIGEGGLINSAWKDVEEENNLRDYTTEFMLKIEIPADQSPAAQQERVEYAKTIYNYMEGIL